MTGGQEAVQAFLRHLGTYERGTNTDYGGWIDRIEHDWGMHGEPWCDMAYTAACREAGVDIGDVGSPSTDVTCERVTAHGWWLPRSHPVPAGAGLIKCGIHIEMAMADAGPLEGGRYRAVRDIGGNVNNGVRTTVRSTRDFAVFCPPDMLKGTEEVLTVYGFTDLTLAPVTYGPWGERAARERVIHEHFMVMDRAHHVQRVYLPGRNHFAFKLYTHPGETFEFGPWPDKATRDDQLRGYARANHAHRTRTWNRQVVHRDVPASALTKGESTQ